VQTPSSRVEICNLIRRQDQLLIKNGISEEIPARCGDILAVIIGLLRGY
jgi:hypothetical protein